MSRPFVILGVLLYFLICVTHSDSLTYKQAHGMINFYDPEYIKDAQAFTGRNKRGESYKSNVTATTLHPWGNNVSFTLIYANKFTGNDQLLKLRCCDAFKHLWIREFIFHYVLKDRKEVCPLPATTYRATNVELPPKNFPFLLPKGDAQLFFIFEQVEKKHVMIKMSLRIKS